MLRALTWLLLALCVLFLVLAFALRAFACSLSLASGVLCDVGVFCLCRAAVLQHSAVVVVRCAVFSEFLFSLAHSALCRLLCCVLCCVCVA